jgi:hypothetical protein
MSSILIVILSRFLTALIAEAFPTRCANLCYLNDAMFTLRERDWLNELLRKIG